MNIFNTVRQVIVNALNSSDTVDELSVDERSVRNFVRRPPGESINLNLSRGDVRPVCYLHDSRSPGRRLHALLVLSFHRVTTALRGRDLTSVKRNKKEDCSPLNVSQKVLLTVNLLFSIRNVFCNYAFEMRTTLTYIEQKRGNNNVKLIKNLFEFKGD